MVPVKATFWLKVEAKSSAPLAIVAEPVPLTAPSRARVPPIAARMPLLFSALSTAAPPAPAASMVPALVMVAVPELERQADRAGGVDHPGRPR